MIIHVYFLCQLMMAPPVISTSTFVMVIRMLGMLCINSPSIAVQLLRQSKSLNDAGAAVTYSQLFIIRNCSLSTLFW